MYPVSSQAHELYSNWHPPKNTEELKVCLQELGWTIYLMNKHDNQCTWFAGIRSDSGAHCECNQRAVSFILTPFKGYNMESVKVEIVGEAGKKWWALKCYNISVPSVIPNLPTICKGLLDSWNSLPRSQ